MKLPKNWKEYSHLEQAKWFLKYVVQYQREGEIKGLSDKFLIEGGYEF